MIKVNYDFPHPVLYIDNDDYINCEFSITHTHSEEVGKSFDFIFTYNLTSSGLSELIKNNSAVVILRFECGATSYRHIYKFPSNSNNLYVKILADMVAKSIVVKGFIVANKKLETFLLSEHNPDYFSSAFAIEQGEVLAYEPGIRIFLDASELEKPITSIINISVNESTSAAVEISLEDEKIKVFLEENTYNNYTDLRRDPNMKRFLAGIVVLPAVVEAVSRIINNLQDEYDEEIAQKLWYRVIKKKLEENGYNSDNLYGESPVKLANLLLGNMVNGSLDSLNETLQREFDGSNQDNMIGSGC